ASHACRQIPNALDSDSLDPGGAAPVVLPGLKRHLYSYLLADKLERPGAHGAGLESVLPHLFVVVLGDNPANTVRRAIEEVQEVDEGLLKVEDDGAVIDDFNVVELGMEGFEVVPFVVFVRPFDICCGEGMTILEFQARA